MLKIQVDLQNKYPIFIHSNLLECPDLYVHIKNISKTCIIISDSTVGSLFAKLLINQLDKYNVISDLVMFPAGDSSKTREEKIKIEDYMLSKGYGRDICILALGGGVTTDMAGFIAATYYRGVPVIFCPTTLLAMVDASIGGKTAVNTSMGKNLIGAFYQPSGIYIDTSLLKSLPITQIKSAVAEIVVHALIADKNLFEFVETNLDDILSLKKDLVDDLVYRNCLIKKKIVELDERDCGIRKILNFGHTVGHAIETCSQYVISHGEAVSLGILVEAYLSFQLKFIDKRTFDRIRQIIRRLAFVFSDVDIKDITKEKIMNAMCFDKKAISGIPRFILLREIGKPFVENKEYAHHVSNELITEAIDFFFNELIS